jgi:hypothetical protein
MMAEAMTTTTHVIDAAIVKRPGPSIPGELVEFARIAVTHPAGVDVLRAICATNCDLELMRYRTLIAAWLAHAEYAELYQDTPGPDGLTWAMARLIDAVIKQEQWSRLRLNSN